MKNVLKILSAILFLTYSSGVNAQVPEKAEDVSPLLIGETIPKAMLQDVDGKSVNLTDLLAQKPTVLVFYRGGWCPYCNVQLAGLMSIEKDILALGYQIVAISPDDYQNLKTTEEKGKIKYQLLSDPNGKFIQDLGIAFQTNTPTKEYIVKKGQKGGVSNVMPVPTVMVVDKNNIIKFEYINPNYKERMNEEMLLAVLKTVK